MVYLPASGEFYEKQRMRCFVRDNFTCQFHQLGLTDIPDMCTHDEPVTELRLIQCHHKKQRIHGGGHELDNLLTICKFHHAAIHPWMAKELPMKDKSLDSGDGELPYGTFEL